MLRTWIDEAHTRPALRLRARIVVLSRDGFGPAAIARELGCSTQTVVTWRERFRASGVDGLSDAPRSGRPATVDEAVVVRATLFPGSAGSPGWSSRSLARHLGVSNVTVANVWRRWGVRPGPSGRVGLRTEPELDRMPGAMLGLYVDPAVRVAAVLVDDRDEPGMPPADGLPGCPGPALARLVAAPGGVGAPDDRADHRELARFVREIGAIAARIRSATGPAPVRLVVEGSDGPVRRWAREHPATAVHLVPEPLSWERVVLVMCLSAATASPGGRASVDRLCTALDRAPGTPFSWSTADPG